jgi:AcrR family transcriptional regulator
LQDVASDVGISHPTVLHHFGSREALVEAVVARAIAALEQDLLQVLSTSRAELDHGVELIDRVYDTLARRGHGRLLAWLILSGHSSSGMGPSAQWQLIAELTHAERLRQHPSADPPPLEDTRFAVILCALALFGEAIAGTATFTSAGLGDDADAEPRFRRWLAELLYAHLSKT